MSLIGGTDAAGGSQTGRAEENTLIFEGERADDLQLKGLRIIQSPASFCFGTDSVLLAHFACGALKTAGRSARVIDLGAGSGALSLLIWARTGLFITAVELDAAQCSRLERSLALNSIGSGATGGATGGIEVVNADYLDAALRFERGFDHAVCNPPYFKRNSGGKPKAEGATHELSADIGGVARAAARLLKYGGRLDLCYPAERLSEAFCALSAAGLEPKLLRLVQSRGDSRPYLALIRAKSGARPGLTVEKNLVIYGENGRYTPEVEGYYNAE